MDGALSLSREEAEHLDAEDPLGHLRKEFIIPSRADLKSETLSPSSVWLLSIYGRMK